MISRISSRINFDCRSEAQSKASVSRGRRSLLLLRCATAALLASAGGAMVLPGPVLAQSAAGSTGSSVPEVVVITASRIERNGFQAPTPTTVIGAADIQNSAVANVADYVNQLPQLVGSLSPQSTGTGVGGGLGGASILNLRDLGTSRTLVLLNGRRVVGAGPTGVVDVNLFPQALISRVDVVTGGASASWGSDAVGGVVNFILNNNFVGFKGSVQGGISTYGDAANEQVSLTYGTEFGNGRDHLVVSALYANADGVAQVNSRPWYNSSKVVRNPAWAAGNGQPYYIVASHVGLATATDGGLITSTSLAGTQFGPNGSTSQFVAGTLIPGGQFQLGGTFVDYAGRLSDLAAVEREDVYLHNSYEFTNSITGYIEAQYGRSYTPYYSGSPFQAVGGSAPPLTIYADNAYLPTSIAAQMAADHIASFQMGRTDLNNFIAQPVNTRQVYRVVAGLDGKLGGDWKWSAYYQYGRTIIDNDVRNNAIRSRLPMAADAVTVTSANVGSSGLALGSIVCRSTLADPSNGCVPENVFGPDSPSAASVAWLTGTAHQQIIMQEHVGEAQIGGTAFSDWAGPVSVVAGVETRTEEMKGDADPISITNGWFVGNYHPLSGSYNVTEGFAESDIPLIGNLPAIELIDFDGAIRYTDYSVSGTVTTWKAGLNWQVNDELRFRATKSRDIRAPNLNDLFLGGQTNTNTITDPQNGNAPASILVTTKGNPQLTPEIASSWGVGVVYQPHWFDGFGLSVDYYDIGIRKAIASFNAQDIVNDCYFGQTQFCSAVTRTGGLVTAVTVEGFNANSETEKGLDIEATYRADLDSLKLPGSIMLRALVTNVEERTITVGGVKSNLLGQMAGGFGIVNGPPRWRGLYTVNYNLGPSTTTFSARYIGSGVVNNTYTQGGNAAFTSINNNTIKSVVYYDLSETYDLPETLGGHFQAFFGIRNLLDTSPPVATNPGPLLQAVSGTSPLYYDLVGRQFEMGIRFRY